jgi:3-methyladenine DNA glycosylase/8-oxoguanine DNA glycosylase
VPSRCDAPTAGTLRRESDIVRISIQQPYDAASLLAFFRQRAIRGVEQVGPLDYCRSVTLNGVSGSLHVAIDPAGGYLEANVKCTQSVNRVTLKKRVIDQFDTATCSRELERCLGADPALAALGMRGMRVPGAWDPFELVVRAILGQQVTVAAARTMASRLCEQFGGRVPNAGAEVPDHTFPLPEVLADADVATIGLPRRRAETIRSFAKAIAAGEIDMQTPEGRREAPARLLGMHGIGHWTVGYVAMRALRDPDAFPRADIALVRAAQRLGIADDTSGLERASERWRPWRAYAAVRLWSSLSA